jgi:hypothetical protein
VKQTSVSWAGADPNRPEAEVTVVDWKIEKEKMEIRANP